MIHMEYGRHMRDLKEGGVQTAQNFDGLSQREQIEEIGRRLAPTDFAREEEQATLRFILTVEDVLGALPDTSEYAAGRVDGINYVMQKIWIKNLIARLDVAVKGLTDEEPSTTIPLNDMSGFTALLPSPDKEMFESGINWATALFLKGVSLPHEQLLLKRQSTPHQDSIVKTRVKGLWVKYEPTENPAIFRAGSMVVTKPS